MRAVIVAGALTPAQDGRPATITVEEVHDRLAHAMLSAAGLHGTKIVRPGIAAEAVFLTAPGHLRGTRSALSVSYRGNFVQSLFPGAVVDVGSLRQLMPEVDWAADPGGMVVNVPSAKAKSTSVENPWKFGQGSAPARPLAGAVTLKAQLPKQPVGVRGPVQRVILDEPRLRGVPLRDGDTVLDGRGRTWFVQEGTLWSHRNAAFDRNDATFEGDLVKPLRTGEPLRSAAPLHVGDPVELDLGSGDLRYGHVMSLNAEGWVVRAPREKHLVQDAEATCFGAPEAATAVACIARGGIWDRPCRNDMECPFYDARRGRGGCLEGICEMPLGVGNKTFRMADPDTPVLDLLGRRFG